jgi:crotonobetainyl-CoA dehydrogenase
MAYSYTLTEEQELLLQSLREWYAQNLDEQKIKGYYEAGGVPEDVQKSYVDAGFGMIGLPEEVGGTEADKLTQLLLTEELSRLSGASLPMASNILAIHDITEFGNEDQIKMVMEYYKEHGKPPFSLAFSEPGAGSDNMNMSAVVRTGADGKMILSGQKTWVSNGGKTDYALVIAKDEDPSRSNNKMSWWLIPMDRKGVKFEGLEKIGNKIMPFGDLFLDDVEVFESDLVGERGKGFFQLMKNFEFERLVCVASMLGEAQAALEDAAKYTLQRSTFEKPIASYQLIQEKLTDMEIALWNTRNQLYECAWRMDNGLDIRLQSSLLKRYGAMSCHKVADEAVQIFGGLGFTTETRVGRIMLDMRGLRIGAGTDEIMVYIAGRMIPKKYANA